MVLIQGAAIDHLHDDLDLIGGKEPQVAGAICQRYGLSSSGGGGARPSSRDLEAATRKAQFGGAGAAIGTRCRGQVRRIDDILEAGATSSVGSYRPQEHVGSHHRSLEACRAAGWNDVAALKVAT